MFRTLRRKTAALAIPLTLAATFLVGGGPALAQNNISCDGGRCDGTAVNDNITGSNRRDNVFANGGFDNVETNDGPDEIHGGRNGNDLRGGNGNDLYFGDEGSDVLIEQDTNVGDSTGDDTMFGG